MKHAMSVERTNYVLTECLDQNWFLLQSVVSVTYPHYTLIACFIFSILALSELFQHLYIEVDSTVSFMGLAMSCSALWKN